MQIEPGALATQTGSGIRLAAEDASEGAELGGLRRAGGSGKCLDS